ncbi:MAG: hypothetical protein GY724_24670, partial [Actinomycetia bacterium]|nr:hypothetical protein [Actinomycetes bacterium]
LPVIISQAYRYEGRGGRVSQRQTRYNLTGTHNAFITGFAYDDLGNLSQIDYPRCLHFPCVGLDPPRSVSFGYTQGFLSSVDGFASSLTYQRGGMLHQVNHANTVVETVEVDPDHPFDRPYRITTSGVTPDDWDSGIYEYDGSGNVKKIGDQLFRYDKMSRLVDGQVEVDGMIKTQAMAYDAFGNILSITTDGNALATPVNAATNRLTGAIYDAG